MNAEYYCDLLADLASDRGTFDSQWNEAAARLAPADFSRFGTHGYGGYITQGQKNLQQMLDSGPAIALHRFASVMESLATPQNVKWHRLVPADEALVRNRQVSLYLDTVNNILFRHRYRAKAGFIPQMQKILLSFGAYGNGTVFVDEADEGGLRYRALHLSEVFFIENHQGVVDGMLRRFTLKAHQIVSQFKGKGDLPGEVITAAQNPKRRNQRFPLIHAFHRKAQYDPQAPGREGMPYVSVYVLEKEKRVISEGAYSTFPSPVMRYMQFANESYGRGPGQIALGAMKVLNEQKKTHLKAGHRAVDPVLLGHDDGVLSMASLQPGALVPGGVNADGRALIQPLTPGNIGITREMMQDERSDINDAFLTTLFQILVQSNDRMTATEVVERAREKGMLIAPTTGRMQSEFFDPLVDRELDLLERQGLLPPPPPVLLEGGGVVSLQYDSPMSRLARAESASGFMTTLQYALEIYAATQDDSVFDWFDMDVAIPRLADINGMPAAWVRSTDEVEARREARNQAQQAQQLLDAAPSLASAAKTAGGVADG